MISFRTTTKVDMNVVFMYNKLIFRFFMRPYTAPHGGKFHSKFNY